MKDLVAIYNEYGFAIYKEVVSDTPLYEEGNSIFETGVVVDLDDPCCETLANIKQRCLDKLAELGSTYSITYQS